MKQVREHDAASSFWGTEHKSTSLRQEKIVYLPIRDDATDDVAARQ